MIPEKFKCTVKTLAGLEEVLKVEAEECGFKDIKILRRAIQFETDIEGVYKANLKFHTAMSVLVGLANFKYTNKDDLYQRVIELPWEEIFDPRQTFVVKGTVYSKTFTNSLYPILLVKDAIADRFRNKFSRRPSVDREKPDIIVDVYLNETFCTISLNSSGEPLYMRGYRNMSFAAPLNECLAAGLVLLSGWDKKENLVSPMCGSGTIAIEAALMASGEIPQKLRQDFAFMKWQNFDKERFNKLKDQFISDSKRAFKSKVIASDVSNRAVSITRNSLRDLELSDVSSIAKADFFKASPPSESGMVILNPPYDERLEQEDIQGFYEKIGDVFKSKYTNHKGWILSSNFDALKSVGLKTLQKIDLVNGKMPCKFVGFDLYEGSKKVVKSGDSGPAK